MQSVFRYFVVLLPIVLIGEVIAKETHPIVDPSIIGSDSRKSASDMNIAVGVTDKPIKIDGVFDEIAWKNAKFFEFYGANKDRATRTRFAIIRNKYGVFFAVECFEPDVDRLDSNCNVRDGLFEWFKRDDWIELLIDPSDSPYDYYWFILNPSGLQTDLCAQAGLDRSWNGRWQAANGRTKSSWTAEIFIPFKTFNRGIVADKWRFQIARLRVNDGKKHRPENKPYSRIVWEGKYRKPATWPTLTGMKLDPKLFAFKISQISIEPSGSMGQAVITSSITNNTSKQVKLRAAFEIMMPMLARGLVPPGTGPIKAIDLKNITLNPNQTHLISAPIHISPQQIVIASLGLYDNHNNLVACSRDRGIRLKCIIDGPGPRLSLYTTQKKANLKFHLKKWSKNSILKISLGENEYNVKATSYVVITSVDIANLAVGWHKIKVTLSEKRKVLGKREFELHKESPPVNGSIACTDRWSQCIVVNAKPFIPVGTSPLITHGLKYVKKMTKWMADNSFNAMHLWGGFLNKEKEKAKIAELDLDTVKACFDYAAKNNLMVIVSLGAIVQNEPSSPFYKFKISDNQRLRLIERLVRFLSSHKQLLGYEIADEPGFFVSPEWLERIYKRIKRIDPYHLVTINNCRGARSSLTYFNASDTVGIDYYPAGNWPVSTVGPLTSELVRFAQYKPVKMWIQGYKIFNPRAPSPAELKMMTWSMFARGSAALFYFIGKVPKKLWDAQGECAREITSLTQAVSSYQRKTLTVEPKDAKVYVSYRSNYESSWIIAVNENNKPADVEIHLPAKFKYGKAKVLFENRTIDIKDNRIKDYFVSFQRHIYKIDSEKRELQ